MERAALIVARETGTPSVLIEGLLGHSLLGSNNIKMKTQLVPEAERPDHAIVMNEGVQKRLLEAGFPAQNAHALGQPVMSEWREKFEKSKVCAALADWVAEKRPVITLATTSRRDIVYKQTDALLKVVALHPEWGFCIKLHPSVGRGEFLAHTPSLPENLRVVDREDILPVVRASSVVIIFGSTIGLLCLSGGVPLLVLDDTGKPPSLPYVASGSARGLDDFEALEGVLVDMLNQKPDVKSPKVSPIFDNPLGASKRIATWLGDLCSAAPERF